MVTLEIAKEIVKKLNSGEYGLLSLAREYKISPKRILELPEWIEKKEKEMDIKKKFSFDQRKAMLSGSIEYTISILDKAMKDEFCNELTRKYCMKYIRALNDLKTKIQKCKDEKEFEILSDLARKYFSGINEAEYPIEVNDPESIFKEWAHG